MIILKDIHPVGQVVVHNNDSNGNGNKIFAAKYYGALLLELGYCMLYPLYSRVYEHKLGYIVHHHKRGGVVVYLIDCIKFGQCPLYVWDTGCHFREYSQVCPWVISSF